MRYLEVLLGKFVELVFGNRLLMVKLGRSLLPRPERGSMIDASSSELESKYHLALAELVVVPHAARGKSVSVSEAATWLGCRSSLILDLIERGLPVVAYNNGSPMLELVDIANLGHYRCNWEKCQRNRRGSSAALCSSRRSKLPGSSAMVVNVRV